MGCLRQILFAGILGLFALTFGLSLLVIGDAGTLGKAAIVSADDLLILFVLNLASLAGLLILMLLLWQGHRARQRQQKSIASLSQQLSASAYRPSPPQAGEQHVTAQSNVAHPVRFCGNCGVAVLPSDVTCSSCGEPIHPAG